MIQKQPKIVSFSKVSLTFAFPLFAVSVLMKHSTILKKLTNNIKYFELSHNYTGKLAGCLGVKAISFKEDKNLVGRVKNKKSFIKFFICVLKAHLVTVY